MLATARPPAVSLTVALRSNSCAVRLAPEPSDKPSDNGPRQQQRLRTAPG